MTEHAYPPDAGYFETSLPDMLFDQAETIRALEEADEQRARWDEGNCAMQWALAQTPNLDTSTLVPVMLVAKMVDDVMVFANTGRRSEWIARALEEVGR